MPNCKFLGSTVWLGWKSETHKRTHRHTEVLIPEYPIRASAFQASACDMSGPIVLGVIQESACLSVHHSKISFI